jgi:AhpD family alkylhydroperoxidase
MLLRERELVVLRTARRCGCDYELSQHYPRAATAGLTSEEIERTAGGPDADGWDEFDAALLRTVDELHDESLVSDATWKVLGSRYGKEELIQLVMLIGYYHMLAYFMNSLGVQL